MTDVFKDSTSHSYYFELVDSTTGLPKTGILFSDVVGSYVRTRAARTAITMATLASASAAYSSGGFILVDDTNQPGVYRFDIPDAAFATGVDEVIVTVKATGCRTQSRKFTLVNINNQIAYAPNVIAGGTNGLFIAGTNAATTITTGLTTHFIGTVDAVTVVNGLAAGVITATSIATDAITDAKVASDVTIASVTGAVGSVTNPVSVTGDLTATMKTSVTTAASAATPVVTVSGTISTLDALNTSLSSTHGAGSWTTATGFSTLVATDIVSNGAITTASGSVSSVTSISQVGGSAIVHTLGRLWALDGSGNAIAPASATTAIQAKTDNLPSDPADQSLLIAAIGSPLQSGSYTAPDNASITAIKAKTDNLPSDPADESLIIAATDAIMGRLGAPTGASVSADIADLPTNAELAIALGTSDDATLAAVEVLRKLLRADHYIDTGVTPWALVYMQEGTGGIGVGVELFRKRLASVTGTNLTSTDTVVGQAKV